MSTPSENSIPKEPNSLPESDEPCSDYDCANSAPGMPTDGGDVLPDGPTLEEMEAALKKIEDEINEIKNKSGGGGQS